METIISVLLLAGIFAAAIGYIVKAKRKGQACVGCPYSGECGKCGGCGTSQPLDSENMVRYSDEGERLENKQSECPNSL